MKWRDKTYFTLRIKFISISVFFQKTTLASLPDEILAMIFGMSSSHDLRTMKAIRTAFICSHRVLDIFRGKYISQEIHVNHFVLRELERGNEDIAQDTVCIWRVSDIVKSAGEYSGLVLELEKLLTGCSNWKDGFITVIAMQRPGMFLVNDFIHRLKW